MNPIIILLLLAFYISASHGAGETYNVTIRGDLQDGIEANVVNDPVPSIMEGIINPGKMEFRWSGDEALARAQMVLTELTVKPENVLLNNGQSATGVYRFMSGVLNNFLPIPASVQNNIFVSYNELKQTSLHKK